MTQAHDSDRQQNLKDRAQKLLAKGIKRAARLQRWPSSTYRLQFHAGFTFRQATEIVPYLAELRVTHCYASPYTQARPGSTHGYDVINHARLNPELGTDADFAAFLDALAAAGMSHILDIVPNHAGVGTNQNKWWNDVLEHGRSSAYADYFDIAWDTPPRCEQSGRVLLPLLGDTLGVVLEKGELRAALDDDGFAVHYYDRRFPLSPESYRAILDAAASRASSAACEKLVELAGQAQSVDRLQWPEWKQALGALYRTNASVRTAIDSELGELNGLAGRPASFDALEALLSRQHYRLASWRIAGDEINYRRFFDINDLAALRMENKAVFDATHAMVMRLLAAGQLAGVRVDHPDGLYDPARYFERLQSAFLVACAKAEAGDDPAGWSELEQHVALLAEKAQKEPRLYVAVEKILALGEQLPIDWPIAGTSGYDALIMLNSVFVDTANADAFTTLYHQLVPDAARYEDLVYQKKLLILDTALAGDLETLTRRLDQIAQGTRHGRDFTQNLLRQALRQLIACFGVYRTYITSTTVSAEDQRQIDVAIEQVRKRGPELDQSVFEFIRAVLLRTPPLPQMLFDQAAAFAGKFQQLTAPATAKGIEDTAFYIYNRLVSLNEVGGEPGHFGVTPQRLHEYFVERQARWPAGMNCLSTHDTKRSEDVRARLNGLSELPADWGRVVKQWFALNGPHRTDIDGQVAPHPNDEYLLYQTLVGAWPIRLDSPGEARTWLERVQAYMQKAMREAKLRTSWTRVNEAYESAVAAFVKHILSPAHDNGFMASFRPFQERISQLGMVKSLAQTAVRLTAPGVPDTYQGTELWDFSLVDPDNRRPVDYAVRKEALHQLVAEWDAPEADHRAISQRLADEPEDGVIKLLINRVILQFRQTEPQLFSAGDYLPAALSGDFADRAFAFFRRADERWLLVCVPTLVNEVVPPGRSVMTDPDAWANTYLGVPKDLAGRHLRNLFTGATIEYGGSSPRSSLPVAQLLAGFPVGIWTSVS